MCLKGWSDLPPDLLHEISGRLHVASDLVIFHAICKLWRNSLDLFSMKKFLPWLLVPTERSSPLKLRCVFSKSSYRVLPPPYPRRTNWVCSADGTTVWYLSIKELRPTLLDPITGAVTDLPCFPCYSRFNWEKNKNPCGIVYGDGTIFLYVTSRVGNGQTARFQSALLRPSSANWMLVDRTFDSNPRQCDFGVAYHNGRMLFTAEPNFFRLVSPDGGADVLVPKPWILWDNCWDRNNYVFESNGELLWVSVHFRWFYYLQPATEANTFSVSVSVHALEEATAPNKLRWVRKECLCLSNLVMFLGWPVSFAVDASLLDGQGGCSYFVYHLGYPSEFGVFRYNFLEGKAECIDKLPQHRDNEKYTWLVPSPNMAPIHEINRSMLESQKLKKKKNKMPSPSRIFHIERHYEHHFRILVHNLPRTVKDSELQLFFSKHGKVSNTKIVCQAKNKKTTLCIGILRMATMYAHHDDVLAALDGMDFYGCSLEVILVNKRKRRKAALHTA